MQTFLPYADYTKSAEVLDYRRLGKQRVETKQILHVLLNENERKGWRNHPAVKMWKGYEGALARYGAAMCQEWIRRGYKDTLLPYFEARMTDQVSPEWVGNEAFHISHQSNLVRKFPEYYQKFFEGVSGDLPYVWPTGA